MPRKKDATPIGTAPCLSCGYTADVYQNTRDYLYMRCRGCKACDQRNDERTQSRMWFALELPEGVQVERPRNVPEARPAWLDEAKPAPAAQVQEPPVPAPAPIPVPTPVPIPAPKKHGSSGPLWVLAAFIGLLAAAAGVAVNATPRSAA